MEDIVREATETEEKREATAGETLFPNGHEGGTNHSDPIPYFGGLTQDAVTLWKNNGTRGIEHVDDELFAAIDRGDEIRVRARVGGDKVLSEREALILIRTRQEAEENAYEKMLEQKLEAAGAHDEEAPVWSIIGHDAGMGMRPMHLFGCDKYGGRYDSKKGRYYDRHGGFYDSKGYRYKDGSYKTAAGDHYDAAANIITLAVGGPAIMVPEELMRYAPHALRMASMLCEHRRRCGHKVATAKASEAEIDVVPVAYSVPGAVARPAQSSDSAYMADLRDQQADELARLEELVKDQNFQSDAAEGPGHGLHRMSCAPATHDAVEFAMCRMEDKLRNGLPVDQLSERDIRDFISMSLVDTDNDHVPDQVKVHISAVPPLSEEANSVFRKAVKDVALKISKLKDIATAVFAKKTGDGGYDVVIELDEKPHQHRPKPAALAMA